MRRSPTRASPQSTSVYEDLVALLRGVASRRCEHWHLQLASVMSDALNAFKNGGEVEAQYLRARIMMMSVQASGSSKLTST